MKTLTHPKQEILSLTSYPPRECGIATYSQDLLQAINRKFSSLSMRVCALEEGNQPRRYPPEVKYTLKSGQLDEYTGLARVINEDHAIEMVLIQHEFGLFGGEYGEYLLQLLYSLRKPVSLVFHTVLPEPEGKRKAIVRALGKGCDTIVVMTSYASNLLQNVYDIPGSKISVIPHGTHVVPWKDKKQAKIRYQLEGKLVLSTFGLLSSNKSIETALEALPELVRHFPNVVYLVLGRTHPVVVAHEGEAYRSFLKEKAHILGIEKHVRFVNKYLTLSELLDYLHLTDIYFFTSKDPHQAVSGTFAYAMGTGCPVISTPIPHALEMLQGDAGFIIDFRQAGQLADAALRLLKDEELRKHMGNNALHQTRASSWENTAISYARLLRGQDGKSKGEKLVYRIPRVSLKHLYRLSTPMGMIQFANISTPDPGSGYTLDDNARALIALCMQQELNKNKEHLPLLSCYLDFIAYCQQANGRFLNYVDKDHVFHIQNRYINLEDSNGRALWALGVLLAHQDFLPASLVKKAKNVFDASLWWIAETESPRAIAFIIKGLYHYYLISGREAIKSLIRMLADKLVHKYNDMADTSWEWFEEYLTYANSSLPEALLYAFLTTKEPAYKMIARSTFEFLIGQLFTEGGIKVISNRGWYHKNHVPEKYGEQPIDVSCTIQALALFHKVFKDVRYLEKMETAFSWFLGNNHLRQIIYNPASGGCYDGLEERQVNLNQGAESTVCYLMARLTLEKTRRALSAEKKQEDLAYDTPRLLPQRFRPAGNMRKVLR